MGSGPDAENALSHFAHIEIHFQDPFFSPYPFDHEGEIYFERLAHPASALPEKNVLGYLLADRTGAMKRFAFLIVLHGFFDGLEIETVMIGEQLVLAADHGQLGIRRNILHRHISTPQTVAGDPASQLGKRNRRIDPFQQEYVEKLKKEQEDDDALENSPDAGHRSLGFRRHPIDLPPQYTISARSANIVICISRPAYNISSRSPEREPPPLSMRRL